MDATPSQHRIGRMFAAQALGISIGVGVPGAGRHRQVGRSSSATQAGIVVQAGGGRGRMAGMWMSDSRARRSLQSWRVAAVLSMTKTRVALRVVFIGDG